MKRLYPVTWAVVALGFVLTAVFLAVAPDTVPVHYNFAGELDRMGSKYEYLLFPLNTLLMGAFLLLTAKLVGKSKEPGAAMGEKICLVSAAGMTALFNGMTVFFLWKALSYRDGAPPAVPALPGVDGMRVATAALGAALTALGNFMPKARRNQIYGVRTRWSLSSEEAWRKSQRFGGFASVAAGAALLVLSLLLEGWTANLAAQCAVLTVWLAACVAASYRYYRAAGGA